MGRVRQVKGCTGRRDAKREPFGTKDQTPMPPLASSASNPDALPPTRKKLKKAPSSGRKLSRKVEPDSRRQLRPGDRQRYLGCPKALRRFLRSLAGAAIRHRGTDRRRCRACRVTFPATGCRGEGSRACRSRSGRCPRACHPFGRLRSLQQGARRLTLRGSPSGLPLGAPAPPTVTFRASTVPDDVDPSSMIIQFSGLPEASPMLRVAGLMRMSRAVTVPPSARKVPLPKPLRRPLRSRCPAQR